MKVDLGLPKWFRRFFSDTWVYFFLYGGRGSAKTQSVAMGLAIKGAKQKLRVVCFRAVMNNVDESVKQELTDAIYKAKLEQQYDIKDAYIRHLGTGTRFTFRGMQKPGSLRGLAGVDIVWIDEAQDVSAGALRTLIPSIRKDEARLIFTFNPIKETDPVWKLKEKHSGNPQAWITKKNWSDNPWFPAKLDRDRLLDLARDPLEYRHVWEGEFWQRTNALIMADKCRLGEEFECPPVHETDDGRYYYGADFGFAEDPNVIMRGWFKDGGFWIDYAAFGYGVELDHIEALYDTVPGSRQWPIMGDSARPDIISLLNRQGFNVRPAPKGPGSVEDGIVFLRSLPFIKIHKRCVEAANEALTYSYKVDPKTDQVLPIIVDANNHFWDSCRYSTSLLMKAQGAYIMSDEEWNEPDDDFF